MEEETKYCRFCGEKISINAKKCKYCHEWLDGEYHPQTNSPFYIESLVHSSEKSYYIAMLVIAIITYVLLTVFTFGIALLYVLIILLCELMVQAVSVAYIRQNTVKITEDQLPDIYDKVVEYSQKLGLPRIPSVYLMQSNGILNAFATKFLSENIVILHSDILELAYEEGEQAVNFIIAHELAHVQRKHVEKTIFLFGAYIIPFLPLAYSRACELTCDKIAYTLSESSVNGLLLLAGGKKLYKNIDVEAFLKTTSQEAGFWSWYSEIFATHPHISTRVRNLILGY